MKVEGIQLVRTEVNWILFFPLFQKSIHLSLDSFICLSNTQFISLSLTNSHYCRQPKYLGFGECISLLICPIFEVWLLGIQYN